MLPRSEHAVGRLMLATQAFPLCRDAETAGKARPLLSKPADNKGSPNSKSSLAISDPGQIGSGFADLKRLFRAASAVAADAFHVESRPLPFWRSVRPSSKHEEAKTAISAPEFD